MTGKICEADQGVSVNSYYPNHYTACPSRQPVPAQYTEEQGLAHTRHIPPETYAIPNNCLIDQQSVIDGHQLRMRSWPERDSNAYSDYWLRLYEYLIAEERKFSADPHLYNRRLNMIDAHLMNPNAFNPSLNTVSTDERQYHTTDEEYFVVMAQQTFVTRTSSAPDSSSNCSNCVSRVHKGQCTKVQGTKPWEDQHQCLQRTDTRSRCIMNSCANYTSPNARQVPPAKDGWQHRMSVEEYNFSMSGQQLGTRTWPAETSSRNAYSNIGSRVHKNQKVKKTREDQHQFHRRRDAGSGGDIMQPDTRLSSPNTKQILPERDGWQHGKREKEYNLVRARRQFRMRSWSEEDSKENVPPTVRENVSKEQEIKLGEDLRCRKTRNKKMKNHKDNPTGTPRKSIPVQAASPRESPVMIDNHHISRDTLEPDSNKDLETNNRSRILASDVTSRVSENSPKEQETVFSENLRCRKTQDKQIKNHKDKPTDGTPRKCVPVQAASPQEKPVMIDNHHINRATLELDSNKDLESNNRSRILASDVTSGVSENSPKEQEMVSSENLRCRKTRNKKTKNHKVNSINGNSRQFVLAQAPYPQELFSSQQIRVTTEDYWIILYAKGEAVCVRLFGIICVLLLVAVMKF